MTSAKAVGVSVAALMAALVLSSGGLRADVAGSGSLLVESDPAGASVYLDGRLAGETPLTLSAIAAGDHRVRVVRLGFLENNRVVTIKSGERATVRARDDARRAECHDPLFADPCNGRDVCCSLRSRLPGPGNAQRSHSVDSSHTFTLEPDRRR